MDNVPKLCHNVKHKYLQMSFCICTSALWDIFTLTSKFTSEDILQSVSSFHVVILSQLSSMGGQCHLDPEVIGDLQIPGIDKGD